jgi:hypothetical protein
MILLEYLTFTNILLILFASLYLCCLAFVISFVIFKAFYYWKRDYWFFVKYMEKDENNDEISDQVLEEVLNEEK